jgi:sugar phosphate isomerase/epimerase
MTDDQRDSRDMLTGEPGRQVRGADQHQHAERASTDVTGPGAESRRDALKKMSGFVFSSAMVLPSLSDRAVAGLARGSAAASPGSGMGEPVGAALVTPVGVQLYTVREEMKKSVEKTLERIAQIGYREVEFAGYYDRTPKQIVATLKANRLAAPASHTPLEAMRKDWNKTLDAASEIGHHYLVCPWIPEEERQSVDNYRRIAGDLNKAAEAAKARGISFAYHNHDFEFQPLAGTIGYDVLLAETDPKLVKMEMDLYWITKGGRDPIQYFEKYPGRFGLVHVKDVKADGEMTEVGAGTIPFAKIFAKARTAGIEHYFVEHDNPKDPFASIAASYQAIRKM